ncbi:prolipoprotein diacylglyceryl transferase family protein [Escherichia coli]
MWCCLLSSTCIFVNHAQWEPVSGLFLIGYGAFRIIVEFFRQPDAQFTGAWVQYISMGQILSIPMIVAGVIMMVWAYRRSPQQHVS